MFRQISIRNRMWLILFIGVFGLGIMGLMVTLNARQKMIDAKYNEAQHLTQTAVNAINAQYERFKNGEITEAEAITSAKNMVKKMALSKRDYFYMANPVGFFEAHPVLPATYDNKSREDILKAEKIYTDYVKQIRAEGNTTITSITIIRETYPDTYTGFSEYYYAPSNGEDDPGGTWRAGDDNILERAEHKIVYSQYFEPWHWIVVFGVYLDDINAQFQQWLINLSATCVGIIAVLTLMVFFISRSISKPLDGVVGVMQDISLGSGDLRHRLTENGRDELSEIGKCYNLFVEKLVGIIQSILHSNQEVIAHSDQLDHSIGEIVSRSQEQLKETHMLASATTELSSSLESVASHTDETAKSAKEAKLAAAEAEQEMAKNTSSIATLSDLLIEVNERMNKTRSDSEAVSAVTEVIQGIAEQTNLLALNAAIEAARAGEQGRGFSVVADEVRNLAQKTQHSIQEINSIIQNLQNGTIEVAHSIDAGVDRAKDCVQIANKTRECFIRAATAVDDISRQSTEIANMVSQQSQVTREIADSSIKISKNGEMNAESCTTCEQVSKKVKDKLQTMDQSMRLFKI